MAQGQNKVLLTDTTRQVRASSHLWKLVLLSYIFIKNTLTSRMTLQYLPLSSHGLLRVCLFCLLETHITRFRAHSNNPEWSHLKTLNLSTSSKTRFPRKITVTDSGGTYLFLCSKSGGSIIQSTTFCIPETLNVNWYERHSSNYNIV